MNRTERHKAEGGAAVGALMPSLSILWTGCGTVYEQLMTNLGKTFSKADLEAGGEAGVPVAHIYSQRQRKEDYKFKASADHRVRLRPAHAMYENLSQNQSTTRLGISLTGRTAAWHTLM